MKKLLYFAIVCIVFATSACSFLASPKTQGVEYLSLLYDFQFNKIKSVAKDEALMQAAFIEGQITEMSPDKQALFKSPSIIVTSYSEQDKNMGILGAQIKFPSGQIKEVDITLRKYGIKWYVSKVQPSLAMQDIYTYE